MARPPATVHVAYSTSRRHGHTSYWAKAAVTDEGFASYNTVRSGIGDSATEAIDCALSYVFETYQQDGLEPPQTTIIYGRVPRADIQNVTFIKRSH
jgi:hypothetical protein